MPQLVGELMDRPYQQVGRYGERGKTTTFREQLLEKIVSEMDYKPSTESYNRDRENVFTKAVRGVVDGWGNLKRNSIRLLMPNLLPRRWYTRPPNCANEWV